MKVGFVLFVTANLNVLMLSMIILEQILILRTVGRYISVLLSNSVNRLTLAYVFLC